MVSAAYPHIRREVPEQDPFLLVRRFFPYASRGMRPARQIETAHTPATWIHTVAEEAEFLIRPIDDVPAPEHRERRGRCGTAWEGSFMVVPSTERAAAAAPCQRFALRTRRNRG